MLDTTIIEVAIGLIFVFSLTAILVTYTNSIITNLLNMRAKQLKQGLQELITDLELQANVLAHPLINMVDATIPAGARIDEATARRITESQETRVNYIEPSSFAEALIGILIARADTTLFSRLGRAIDSMESSIEKSQLREMLHLLRQAFSEKGLRDIYAVVQNIENEAVRQALIDGLRDVEQTISQLRFQDGGLVALLEGLRDISDTRVRAVLETILTTSENIEKAQKKLETWFNEGMGRVTEVFKRNIQFISLSVAMTIAVVFNIDALQIARSLWENPELRQDVAAAAAAFELSEAPDDVEPSEDIDEQIEDARETAQILVDLQLPIGWSYREVTDDMVQRSRELGLRDPLDNTRNAWNLMPANNDAWFWLLIQKVLGLMVTTVAAAQGAPFWFDLLRRLTTRD